MITVLDDDSLHNDEIAKREAIVTALGNVGCETENKSESVVDKLAERWTTHGKTFEKPVLAPSVMPAQLAQPMWMVYCKK
jgi:DNA-binding transcriptional regulator LsrR (DeoR family)